jgi:hypothetical protein
VVEADAPVLVSVPLSHILTFWRPGSGDWSWSEEYTKLIGAPVTDAVCARVNAEGFGFHDHIAPVLLGSDNRVWDGHHRIILAIQQAVPSLMVEFAGDDLRPQRTPPPATPEEDDRG